MKSFLLLAFSLVCAFLLLVCPYLSVAQDSTGTGVYNSGVPVTWLQYIGYVLAAYEVLIRIFPTVKDITILGNIFKFLAWVSNGLNKKA